MDILNREMSFDSCVDDERIFVRIIEPENRENVRAVLQIAHGMAEHSLLYVDFAKYMALKGYAVAVNDHLGHGKSVSSGGAYGYFGKGGCQNLIDDMHKLCMLMKKDYPKVPYILMGYSMGSFLAREYTVQFKGELNAAIYLGTCGNYGKINFAVEKALSNTIVKKKGEKSHDKFFTKHSTKKYNKIFSPIKYPYDWLSSDTNEVDKYVQDPLCGFDLTSSAYRDVVYLQSKISSSSWFKNVPYIPILMISGERDPVGDFGKGVKRVAERLKKTGHNVKFVLYPEARHNVLCETNKHETYDEIRSFIENVVNK